jgi:hypothetical protein
MPGSPTNTAATRPRHQAIPVEFPLNRSWLTLLDELRKAYDDLDNLIEWSAWGQALTTALYEGKVPPPSPALPDFLQAKLEAGRARIAGLAMPPFDANLPAKSAVPTGSFDITRTALRQRISDFQVCIAEYAESGGVVRLFEELAEELTSQQALLSQLATVLLDLAPKLHLIGYELALSALDLERSYIKTVAATRDALETKRKSADTVRATRREALLAAGRELKNYLLVEAIDLKSEANRLQDLDEQVQQLQQQVVLAVEVRDAATRDKAAALSLLNAATQKVQEADNNLTNAKAAVWTLESDIQRLQTEADQPYVCPIAGVSYEVCIEPKHILFKIAYNNKRKELQTTIQKRLPALDTARTKLNSASDVVKQSRQREQDMRRQLDSADGRLSDAVAALNAAKDHLTSKARFVEGEKWKSRADVFMGENGTDESGIDAALARLGRTP